jgi:hypothetical protein
MADPFGSSGFADFREETKSLALSRTRWVLRFDFLPGGEIRIGCRRYGQSIPESFSPWEAGCLFGVPIHACQVGLRAKSNSAIGDQIGCVDGVVPGRKCHAEVLVLICNLESVTGLSTRFVTLIWLAVPVRVRFAVVLTEVRSTKPLPPGSPSPLPVPRFEVK